MGKGSEQGRKSISFGSREFGRKLLYYGAILGVLCCGSYLILSNYYREMKTARDRVLVEERHRFDITHEKVNHYFSVLYRGLRTIAYLPAIRALRPDLKNHTRRDQLNLLLIYNMFAAEAGVSEIYILQRDFNPDAIDPRSGRPMVPLLMYDRLITGRSGGSRERARPGRKKIPELEIHEYRELRNQLDFFRKQYGRSEKFPRYQPPALSSQEVITCDNSEYSPADKNDSNRMGIAYTLPVYGNDRRFRGGVAAIIRTNIIRRLLPAGHIIYNQKTGYRIHHTRDDAAARTLAVSEASDGDFAFVIREKMTFPDQSPWEHVRYIREDGFGKHPVFVEIRMRLIIGVALLILFALVGGGYLIHDLRNRRSAALLIDQIEAFTASSNDLSFRFREDITGQLGRVARNFNQFLEEYSGIIRDILNSVSVLKGSADDLAAVATDFSQNAQNQAANVEEITASIEEVTASLDAVTSNTHDQSNRVSAAMQVLSGLQKITMEMSARIQKVTEQADQAVSQGQLGGDSLKVMDRSMRNIEASSDRMKNIAAMINDIADRINLLSLNASIEAARAGDAGRGFAVVAEEISKLADQTANSIREIDALIQETGVEISGGMDNTKSGIKNIGKIIQLIGTIDSLIRDVARYMESQLEMHGAFQENMIRINDKSFEIKNAMVEQKNAISEIASTINSVNETAQKIAESADGLLHNSEMNRNLADSLKSNLDSFDLGDRSDPGERKDPGGRKDPGS